jgi:4-aminobutyrate aminotransferase-like enzyme/Ser/Thr protein kinase RdoA (MazF antagonist)
VTRLNGVDFLALGALPAPRVEPREAQALVSRHFGFDSGVEPLGSQQDSNFLLRTDGEILGVLKLSNPAFTAIELDAQDAAVKHLAREAPQLRLPALVTRDGLPLVTSVNTAAGPARARVLAYLPGGSLADCGYLAPGLIGQLGAIAATVSIALRNFDHEGLERRLQWDPQYADRVVDLLIGHVPDSAERERLTSATAAAWARLDDLAADLPRQAVHLDINDDNVICSPLSRDRRLDGVIDFGDVTTSWAVSELAAGMASVLFHPGSEPCSVLPFVRAFHHRRALSEAEVDALWPLVALRAVVLVLSGVQQAELDGGENAYVADALGKQRRALEQALSVPLEVMTALLRDDLGLPVRPPVLPQFRPVIADLDPDYCLELDLSPASPSVDDGAWVEHDLADRLAAAALEARDSQAQAVHTRFGAAMLPASRMLSASSPATVSTGIDVWLGQRVTVTAPWSGQLSRIADDRLVVAGDGVDFSLTWSEAADVATAGSIQAGDSVLTLAAGAWIRLRLQAAGTALLPDLVRPEYGPGWLSLAADPAPLLGLPSAAPQRSSGDLLNRREAVVAPVQEHYYREPPQIERGWRHHLIDTSARVYLDMVNNVTALGHAHPGVVKAMTGQLRRLNTNSRFHYSALVEFAERLTALLPDPLDTVFFVNSGSESVDLALRLAFAATGHADVVAVREAYHGWTYAADAVSTSTADNPHAPTTRPPWVHTVEAPNTYRGRYRGVESVRYAEDAVAVIDDLAASGTPAAAFIAEAYYGNAGGMALPDGYLQQVYAAVRRHGGLAIADEVQVNYGRLGGWFWGFEQQQVVPDVVTAAKAIGNGHPLGAVITSKAIAHRFEEQGYFFASTGGSPVSAVAGLAVLDALQADGLQPNAARVGAHLKARLSDLARRHQLIGAVHGDGLYLGVEFVRDRDTLEPATQETYAVCERLRELGVIMQPTGERMCVLKIKPPLCIDVEGADFFADMLDRVLTEGW